MKDNKHQASIRLRQMIVLIATDKLQYIAQPRR